MLVRSWICLYPPENGTQPCREFPGIERFDQVVICAGIQTADAGLNFPSPGDYDHGYGGNITYVSCQFRPVTCRKGQVNKQHVQFAAQDAVYGGVGGLKHHGFITFTVQMSAQYAHQTVVIFDNADDLSSFRNCGRHILSAIGIFIDVYL